MPVYTMDEGERFAAHGSHFDSFVRGARGAESLCAWRLEVTPGLTGVAHRPSHEEVMIVLSGTLLVTLDGVATSVRPQGVVHVPAGAELRVDGGPEGASVWVTTTRGLTARIGEESMAPPWAQ